MSANFKTHIQTKSYEKPLTEKEIERECDKERQFHRLAIGRSISMCQCGKSFVDPTRGDIRWRHESHVKEAITAFENKLRGIAHAQD